MAPVHLFSILARPRSPKFTYRVPLAGPWLADQSISSTLSEYGAAVPLTAVEVES